MKSPARRLKWVLLSVRGVRLGREDDRCIYWSEVGWRCPAN